MNKTSLLKFFIIGLIVFNLFRTITPQIHNYLRTDYWDRYPALRKMYYDSIYANKKGDFIKDEFVYSFAAGSIIKGVSPILVNPEMPPLGKYFIALSILIFRNEHMVILLFGMGALLMLYLLGRQIFSSTIISLIPVLLITCEPLFLNQLIVTPLLDIIQLFFLLAFFYFFNIAYQKDHNIRYYLIANAMVGGFISTKFFGTGITLIGAAVLVLLLQKNYKQIISYTATLIIAPILLLLMYVQVLFSGYSLSAFLGIQKWILLYNSGHLTKYFTFFPLFLFNKWYSWWDTSILSDAQWQFTWPLSFITFLVVLILYFRKKAYRSQPLHIILAWIGLYILILQTGYMSARYFVILLPPLFLVLTYSIRLLAQYSWRRLR